MAGRDGEDIRKIEWLSVPPARSGNECGVFRRSFGKLRNFRRLPAPTPDRDQLMRSKLTSPICCAQLFAGSFSSIIT